MARKLPPLNALKAFEAIARHCNFTKAAEELSVTQGAVSKQAKILEEYLGVVLFQRKPQQVTLTKQGQLYLPSIQSALDTMEQATDQLMHSHRQTEILHINILPSLSSRWLIPLLDNFRHRYPRISVNITVGDGSIDFDGSQADIAIRVAKKNLWKQYFTEKIMGEELLPVCIPSLENGKHPIHSPDDLRHHQLLQHTTRPDMWQEYLQDIGYGNVKIKHTLGFEHFFMLIEAALDGLGIALIPRFLIEKELAGGRLTILFKAVYQSPYNYYLISPKHKMELKKSKLFRDWLIASKHL